MLELEVDRLCTEPFQTYLLRAASAVVDVVTLLYSPCHGDDMFHVEHLARCADVRIV
jgi:hypothetical protein